MDCFLKSRPISCLHWRRICRTKSGWKRPSDSCRRPTAGTTHPEEPEVACVLCVKYCSWRRFQLESVARSILSHTQISHIEQEPPKPQSGKIEFCLGELKSPTAAGTKPVTDQTVLKGSRISGRMIRYITLVKLPTLDCSCSNAAKNCVTTLKQSMTYD